MRLLHTLKRWQILIHLNDQNDISHLTEEEQPSESKENEDLTDTGVSKVSIPNTGFTETYDQGEVAPRKWEHKLPFFAQEVIDLGYDLPLPYGAGVNYAYVAQDLLLSNIEVGICRPILKRLSNHGSRQGFQFNMRNFIGAGTCW